VTSNINYLSINENFPVAGQDNDTQVFRDNFDTIKTSFNAAKTEITDLQNNTAKLNEDNDFDLHIINNAVLQFTRDATYPGGLVNATPTTLDYRNGSYQIYTVGSSLSFDFLDFPGDPVFTTETTPVGVGRMRLELYSNGGVAGIVPGGFVAGEYYQITSLGTAPSATTNTQWNTIAGTSGVVYTVNRVFQAAITGTGLGNGVARQLRKVTFSTNGSTYIKSLGFPGVVTGSSNQTGSPTLALGFDGNSTSPIIIDIWRRSLDTIFMQYIGQFN
jgi:hypothetical protein